MLFRSRLILFSEAGVTGYTLAHRQPQNLVTLGDPICKRLHALARRHRIAVAAGFFERKGSGIHVSHAVFFPSGELVVQRKARRGTVDKTIKGLRGGPAKRVVFEVNGIRCAISICADSGIANLWNDLARQGVQLHLLPTAGCGPRSLGFTEAELDQPARLRLYLKRAESVVFSKDAVRICRKHRIAMATCNQMANDGIAYFQPGHSMIVDSTGELAALIPGCFVFEHLRERIICGHVHPHEPKMA